jgi:hypothetical protein
MHPQSDGFAVSVAQIQLIRLHCFTLQKSVWIRTKESGIESRQASLNKPLMEMEEQ